MSQKQACAIFATSFLAGLLVTAVVFQPFSSPPADTPYFGFPGETPDHTASNNQVKSEGITVSQPSPPQLTESLVVSNLPNEFAESFSNTLREHLLTPGEIPTDTTSFPQAMMLSTEEILSLENLAKRADKGSVSVTAFNGIPASEPTEQSKDSPQLFGIDGLSKDSVEQFVQSPVNKNTSKLEAHPVLERKTDDFEADAVDSATSVATEKSKPLVSNDDSSYLKKNPLPSAVQTSADRPVPN